MKFYQIIPMADQYEVAKTRALTAFAISYAIIDLDQFLDQLLWEEVYNEIHEQGHQDLALH